MTAFQVEGVVLDLQVLLASEEIQHRQVRHPNPEDTSSLGILSPSMKPLVRKEALCFGMVTLSYI
jgi:hypothetical protein